MGLTLTSVQTWPEHGTVSRLYDLPRLALNMDGSLWEACLDDGDSAGTCSKEAKSRGRVVLLFVFCLCKIEGPIYDMECRILTNRERFNTGIW